MITINKLKIFKTSIDGIGYAKICPGVWQAIDLDGNAQVGPQYASRAELLACIRGWAQRQGYDRPK